MTASVTLVVTSRSLCLSWHFIFKDPLPFLVGLAADEQIEYNSNNSIRIAHLSCIYENTVSEDSVSITSNEVSTPSPGTNVTGREAIPGRTEPVSQNEDSARIRELRNVLHLSQEAFGRECGVGRVAAVLWESGKTSPTTQAWCQMAKMAGKAAPPMAPWFWEKVGIDREAIEILLPELQKLSKKSEQRIRKLAEEQRIEFSNVPIMSMRLSHDGPISISSGLIEKWISMPKDILPNDSSAFALSVSHLFVRPIFSLGDVVVIDLSEKDVAILDDQLVLVVYSPDAETTRASELLRRGHPLAPSESGRWPHLKEGLYLGWVKTDETVGEHSIVRYTNLNSSKLKSRDQSFRSEFEFSVPLKNIRIGTTEESAETINSEATVLGRVICWISQSKAPR